jgi:vacuolar-type H+-ATPase subunit H
MKTYSEFIQDALSVNEEYQDLTPEKEERVKKRVGELARDVQVQGERMKELKKKPFGGFRPRIKKEKEQIVKSARKKAKLVSNASDALIRTSTSRSAALQKRIQDLKNQS